MRSGTMGASRPLEGIRVVELGQLIAGPFAGSVLAYFGAEVVKVEPPGGATQSGAGACCATGLPISGGCSGATRSR